jgi:hypothetical protein
MILAWYNESGEGDDMGIEIYRGATNREALIQFLSNDDPMDEEAQATVDALLTSGMDDDELVNELQDMGLHICFKELP